MRDDNLPPGVTIDMIPGNSTKDLLFEKLQEETEIAEIHAPIHWDLNRTVVVLNDGETFTSIRGCKVILLPRNMGDVDEEEFIKFLIPV